MQDTTKQKLSALAAEAGAGAISRRQFMARAAALGAGGVLSSGLFAQAVQAAMPKQGGKFRVGVAHGSTTDSLDPATFENGYMAVLNVTKNNHLAEVTVNGLEPELAESWEASADAATWRFKIRQGVEFHNGKTLDANDVVASINHHRHEDSKSAAKALLKPVTDVGIEGGDTVVISLDGGNADFPYIISDYHIAILPADGDGIDWQSGAGCGGYRLDAFEPGVRSDFTRFENYWKAPHRAHFDEVELLSIVDVAARTNALQTGEIDAMDRCDLKTVHLLAKTPGVRVEETTGTGHYSIPMRTDTAPFDNNDVRLALKYALDREALLKTVLRGHGTVGNDHPISPANHFHASELPQRTYDPDKAKFHLQQAGLSTLSVDLSAADAAFAGAVDAAVLYKEHAAPIGIEINVVREPNDGYWSNVWMNKPWGMCYWGGRPTEDWMFSTAYAAGAAWNDSFWEHERFNKLLLLARAELDQALRREMYVEMQTIVSNEGGVVVPLFNNYVFATSDKIGHGELAGNWDLDGSKLTERWWFA